MPTGRWDILYELMIFEIRRRRRSAQKILLEMAKHTGETRSLETIRRVLHNAGYHDRNVRKKP